MPVKAFTLLAFSTAFLVDCQLNFPEEFGIRSHLFIQELAPSSRYQMGSIQLYLFSPFEHILSIGF